MAISGQRLANDVSADGSVVVGYSRSSFPGGMDDPLGTPTIEAFIWDATNGMRSLQDVLTNDFGLGSTLAGWTLTQATAISADGLTIVGLGFNPDGRNEAWIATIDFVEKALKDLIVAVFDLNLQAGIDNSLDAKLDAVLNALDDANLNNDQAAIGALDAFVNAVQAQSGKQIDGADAAQLIEDADEIILLILLLST